MEPKIYTSADHHIRNHLIDPHALHVLKILIEAGFESYLVGGGVRDLLRGNKPKDFDISTAARPEQVKKLFRKCILVGRRFRLAHVHLGNHIIEVSTFRSGEADDQLILRDNIWGTPEQDAKRRDFTINALFYDPLDHKIIDYVDGFNDLKENYLRLIGDPKIRFKQDPVRMIRMQKFHARFGFHIQKEALQAQEQCLMEIKKSSPARILEEIFRMLESGFAQPFFLSLQKSGLLKLLFPHLNISFLQEEGTHIYSYLKVIDTIHQQKKHLDRSVLAAALIFPILEKALQKQSTKMAKIPHLGMVIDLSYQLVKKTFSESFFHFPRKICNEAHFILHMQYRFTPLNPRKQSSTRFIKQKHFNKSLLFLKIRSLVEHKQFKTYEYWKRLSSHTPKAPRQKK